MKYYSSSNAVALTDARLALLNSSLVT